MHFIKHFAEKIISIITYFNKEVALVIEFGYTKVENSNLNIKREEALALYKAHNYLWNESK